MVQKCQVSLNQQSFGIKTRIIFERDIFSRCGSCGYIDKLMSAFVLWSRENMILYFANIKGAASQPVLARRLISTCVVCRQNSVKASTVSVVEQIR